MLSCWTNEVIHPYFFLKLILLLKYCAKLSGHSTERQIETLQSWIVYRCQWSSICRQLALLIVLFFSRNYFNYLSEFYWIFHDHLFHYDFTASEGTMMHVYYPQEIFGFSMHSFMLAITYQMKIFCLLQKNLCIQ